MNLIEKMESIFRELELKRSPQERLGLVVRRIAIAGHGRRKPKYYTQRHGRFASVRDFDTEQMIQDFSVKFSTLSKDEIRGVVMQGIYQYYLR